MDTLNNDCWRFIFSMLNISDLLSLRQSNTLFYNLITTTYNRYWFKVYQNFQNEKNNIIVKSSSYRKRYTYIHFYAFAKYKYAKRYKKMFKASDIFRISPSDNMQHVLKIQMIEDVKNNIFETCKCASAYKGI